MPRQPKRRCFAAGCEYIRTEDRACDATDRPRKRLHRFPNSAQILLQAVRQKDTDAVKDLLRRGVGHPNSTDHRGWTPLHEAAALNQLEIVKILLEDERTNPEASSYSGDLALNVAVESSASVEVVEYLAHRTPQFNEEDYASCLLYEAAITASAAVVKYIVTNTTVDIQGNKGITSGSPVFRALLRNDEKVVEVLLDACDDVNDLYDETYHKKTIAFAIELECTLPIIRMLIKKGALLNFGESQEEYGTALTLAIALNKTAVALELLNHDVDVNLITNGCIALVSAVCLKQQEVVAALIPVTSLETLESLCEEPYFSGIICCALSHYDDNILSMLLHCNFSEPVLEAPVPIRLALSEPSLLYYYIGPLAFLLKERMDFLGNQSFAVTKLLLSKGISFEPRRNSYVPPVVGALIAWSRNQDKGPPKEALRMLLDLGVNVDHQSQTVLPDALLTAIHTKNIEALLMLLPYSRYTPCDILRIGFEHQKHFICAFVLSYLIAVDDYSELSHFLKHPVEGDVELLNKCSFKAAPLAILARRKVRRCLQTPTNSSEFLNIIGKLEIPETLKYFLRFM